MIAVRISKIDTVYADDQPKPISVKVPVFSLDNEVIFMIINTRLSQYDSEHSCPRNRLVN